MQRLGLLVLVTMVLAPAAAQPGTRPAIPVSLLRIGDEYYAPTPPRRLTSGESIHAFAFSPDGNYLAFVSTEPVPRDTDIAEVLDVLRRGRVALVDVRSGVTRELIAFPIREGATEGVPSYLGHSLRFSPDSGWLAVELVFIPQDVFNEWPEERLAVIRVADGTTEWVRYLFSPLWLAAREAGDILARPTFAWHPTRPILAVAQLRVLNGEDFHFPLWTWDLRTGEREVLGTGIGPLWSRDGSMLHFFHAEPSDLSFKQAEIRFPALTGEPPAGPRPAEDGDRWQVVAEPAQVGQDAQPLVVREVATGRETVVARPAPGIHPRPLAWSSDGALLLYAITQEVTDPVRARAKGYVVHYWVYNAADRTPDCTALIAVDTWHLPEDNLRGSTQLLGRGFRPAAWGPTGTEMAFIRDGDLWLTALLPAGFLRTPSVSLGMPEQEARELALRRVVAVGQAARRYADEHDGSLPDAATFAEALRPYLDHPEVLYIPNQPGVLGITWLAPAGFNLDAVPLEDLFRIPIVAMFWPPGYVALYYCSPGGATRYLTMDRWDQGER